MFLSAKAEYACVALLELAARHGDPKPSRLEDVAERHGLKKPFLVQILLQLKENGLVSSTRGAKGGYQLSKDPADISLWDVLAVVDRQDAIADRDLTPSALTGALHAVWNRIAEAREGILRGTSLADLLPEEASADYII